MLWFYVRITHVILNKQTHNILTMKNILYIVIFIGAVIFIGWLLSGEIPADDDASGQNLVSWHDVVFTDVITGGQFKISDFQGKKILIESFAVWCPTCVRQQKEMQRFALDGGDAIHISLDTDPNEDKDLVRNHIIRNNFDWRFAVAPIEFTRAIIDEFGLGVVNAPAAPVILICEDGSSRFLGRGLKLAEDLSSELKKGC